MSLFRTLVAGLFLLGGSSVIHQTSYAEEVSPPELTRPDAIAYVIARDGHFYLGDRRVRLWGINLQAGAFPSYEEIGHLADRLSRLGVNAVRLWPVQGTFYDAQSLVQQRFRKSTIKDGSLLDRYDYMVSEFKRRGIFIQNTALHYVDIDAIRYWPTPETRNILGPNASPGDIRKLHGIAPYLSPAWEAMLAAQIQNYLSHVNPYTQRAYADEPVFSGWELSNESQFVHCALRAECVSGLPVFLRSELTRLWQLDWKQKGGAANLSLPIFDQDWDRADKPTHSAYRQFVMNRFVLVSQRLENSARKMAPAGKGIAVQPITYSTQAGDPLLVARVAYSAGDYSAIGAYQTPTDDGKGGVFAPYRLNLAQPIYYNFNYGGVQGKPTVVYEHSFFRPNPYRAEWSWALAFLAGVQDWDGLFLYSYGQPWAIYDGGKNGPPYYGSKPLPTPSDPEDSAPRGVYVGLHHGGDEVTMAAWSAAGQAYLNGGLLSGVNAKPFSFSQKQIFGPAPGYCLTTISCSGGTNVIADMNATSLAQPIRLQWNVGNNKAVMKSSTFQAIRGGSQSVSNRSATQLLIDTPTSKAVVGLLEGEVKFSEGYVFRFPRKQFGFVSLTAADGKALQQSLSIRVYATGKSNNTGYVFKPERVNFKRATGVVSGVHNAGKGPVMFERLDFSLSLPRSFAKFERFDFNFQPYQSGAGSASFSIRPTEPFFMGVLSE